MCGYCHRDSNWSGLQLKQHVEELATRLANQVALVHMQTPFEDVHMRGGGDGLHLSAAENTELFEQIIVGVLPRHPLAVVKFPGPVKTVQQRQRDYQRRRARKTRGRILTESGAIEKNSMPSKSMKSVVKKAPVSRRQRVKQNRVEKH